ncbi:hypothetical protein pb186bvf_010906 [Paramecium bursaria]
MLSHIEVRNIKYFSQLEGMIEELRDVLKNNQSLTISWKKTQTQVIQERYQKLLEQDSLQEYEKFYPQITNNLSDIRFEVFYIILEKCIENGFYSKTVQYLKQLSTLQQDDEQAREIADKFNQAISVFANKDDFNVEQFIEIAEQSNNKFIKYDELIDILLVQKYKAETQDQQFNAYKTLLDIYENPKTKSYLYTKLGQLQLNLQDNKGAIENLAKGLELSQNKEDQALIHSYLGMAYFCTLLIIFLANNQFPQAIKNYQSSCQIYQELKQLSQLATNETLLGDAFRMNSQLDQALDMLLQSLERKKQVKQSSLSIASTLSLVGQTCKVKKDIRSALWYFHEALEYYKVEKLINYTEEILLKEASTLDNQGECFKYCKRFQDAIANFKDSLRLKQESLGYNHKQTIITMILLATTYYQHDQYKESLNVFQQILESQKSNESETEVIASTQNNIAQVLLSLKQYDQALQYSNSAVQGLKNKFGDDHDIVKKAKTLNQKISQFIKE